ncbi:MAG: 50S ribosomal protein L25 [bacterium]
MENLVLDVQERWKTGKGIARKLRGGGRLPAICYRKGTEPVAISLDSKKLDKLLQGTAGQNALIELQFEGPDPKKKTVILKDIQRHPLAGILHVDFLEVLMDEAITVEVPLKLTGEPIEAIRLGGMVQQLRRTIEVECLPARIPEHVTLDISSLNLGDSLHVQQIQVDPDVRVLTDPKEPVVVISAPVEEKVKPAEAAEEGAAEGEAKETKEGGEKAS